jgi:ribosomal protein S27AE
MADPQKNFICSKCGYIINDTERLWGRETECPKCMDEKRKRLPNHANSADADMAAKIETHEHFNNKSAAD